MLSGKAFYLPGSIDVKNQPLDQWNIKPPPLSLWSRSDRTAKHVEVAEKHGHIEKKQTTPHQEALRAVSDYLMEENHDCFGDFSNIMTDYPDITTLLDDVPEEETDATQLNCETINMTSDTLDDLVNMDLSSPISSSNNTRSDPIRLSLPCIQPGPHPGFSPPHYANTSDPYGPGAQFVYPQPGHYATNYDYPNYSYPGSSSNYGQPDFTSEECISPPVGCGRLKKGGACYSLYNAINHASVAMNLYFLSRGRNTSNCDFKNSGLLSVSDPNMRYKVAELAAH